MTAMTPVVSLTIEPTCAAHSFSASPRDSSVISVTANSLYELQVSEATGRESELKRKNKTLEVHKRIIAVDIFCPTRKYNDREPNLMKSPSSQMDSMPMEAEEHYGKSFLEGTL